MNDEQFHLLRARLESLLHGGELTGLQAMTLKTMIKARIVPAPDPFTVYTALGAPDGYEVAPEPKKPARRRGRPPGSGSKGKGIKQTLPRQKTGRKPNKRGRNVRK